MSSFSPQTHLRDVPIIPSQAVLVVIDIQNFCSHKNGGQWKQAPPGSGAPSDYYWKTLDEVVLPNISMLQTCCRKAGVEVMFVVMESLTVDGRDRSLDYKISGFNIPRGSWDAQVLDVIKPIGDEMVISKTSSSAFVSTNIDYVLRNMGKKQIVIVGGLTDQCVESAVRDACDLGYLVTLVPDACITVSAERQSRTLDTIKGYCRYRSADELAAELG